MSNDRDLIAADEGIRKLRVEYDLYTSGQRKRPPDVERRHLDQLMKRLAGITFKDSAERFRYSNLLGRYNLYCERWEKQLREYEEGPRDPRKRRQALAGAEAAPPKPSAVAGRAPDASGRASVEIAVGGETAEDVRRLFDRYVAAREASGEAAAALNFDRFQKLIQEQSAAISRKTGAVSVEFEVKLADGKAKLVAKPKGRTS